MFPLPVGAAPCGRPHPARELAENWLKKLPEKFSGVQLDKYVVMPNHIHILLRIDRGEPAGGHTGPPLQSMVDWYKTMTTNAYIRAVKADILPPYEKQVWQRGYYDYVVRGEKDYLEIWQYIDNNPAQWREDKYYNEVL